jgi:prepilin-type N-terminal cleavage/methylation domain-containing protein
MKNKGFTFLELMIILAIVGILAVVGLIAYNHSPCAPTTAIQQSGTTNGGDIKK